MKSQRGGAVDAVAVFPLLGRSIAARREEPVQNGEKDGPFDGEFEAPVCEWTCQDFANRAGFSETLEDGDRQRLLCVVTVSPGD